jgi:hypothetical protein
VNGEAVFGAARAASGLTDAFEVECRLLGELAGLLRRQREGVATDDVTVVDESVFAANRVLPTLEEARRRRRTLLQLVAGAQDDPVPECVLCGSPCRNCGR